ncbi:succinate dehydrogenase subunit 7, mitochondrial isoform X2 [Elaeis guineensis]|uniref:Succinate dehydrogenase subunit 7, mitochondrial isoform X2 n=1 Tax=Elaeis guineensis var. tenera TaxID=51953 RepID=A0A6I9QQU9_ELAGV|nr:succinate dehydrogenase subunit 7, mitochondrial isoform X2 [Elaeis guineensis]
MHFARAFTNARPCVRCTRHGVSQLPIKWRIHAFYHLPREAAHRGPELRRAAMAGPLSKSSLFSILRSHSQKAEPALHLPRRGYHVELGAREKALLEEDPALKKFKSYKNTVKRVSKIGDALSVLVVAG